MINEYDVGAVDEELEILGSFKPENLLYNLKRDILVDRQNLGVKEQINARDLEQQVKYEGGKTLILKNDLNPDFSPKFLVCQPKQETLVKSDLGKNGSEQT